MISYRSVISCKFPVRTVLESGEEVITNELKYFPIDYLNDRDVNANSHVATQPMQRGDYMADHMYRDPVTLNLSGQFSMNGRNWNNKSYEFMSTNNRLTDVQKTFEYIKNNGILCNIVTIATNVDTLDAADADRYDVNNTRFISRENMALEGIRWTEKVNSINFAFSFKEVITVEEVEYDVDTTDMFLPNVEGPKEASFGTLLMETNKLPEIVVKALYDKGLIKKKWAQEMIQEFNDVYEASIGNSINYYPSDTKQMIEATKRTLNATILNPVVIRALAVAVGAIVVAKICAAVAVAAGATASIVPVGTIIVGVAAVAVAIGAGIYALWKNYKNRKLAKKAFKNGKEDLERLDKVCADVEKEINAANIDIKVIEIQSDDDQEISLSIGGSYFYISFTAIPDVPYFNVQITSTDERWTEADVKSKGMPYITSIDELETERVWFKNHSNKDPYEIYLMNVNVNDDVLQNSEEEKNNILKKLSTYQIWIVKNEAKKAMKNLQKSILDATLESL